MGFVSQLNEKNGMPIPFSFPARNAPEIIRHFAEENSISALVNVVMAVPISDNPPPPFCLLIYGTDNKYDAKNVYTRWQYITNELNKVGIDVMCWSADSDPRNNAAMKMISKLGQVSQTLSQFDWFCCGDKQDNFEKISPVCVQDPTHLGCTMRNLLLRTIASPHKLPFGHHFIQQSHLKELISMFSKDKHNLTQMVLNPIDKQNFESVLRICNDTVINLLLNHVVGSQATAKFLELMKHIIDSYMDATLDPLVRIYKSWYSTFFCRLWRVNIKSNKTMTLKENFLTLNCYTSIELNAHAMIQNIVQLKKCGKPNLFMTHLLGSQACESIFRQIRSFTYTYSTVANCTVKEILQRISKIQLQSDIRARIGTDYVFPRLIRPNVKSPLKCDLPTFVEIKATIEKAKTYAIKDAISLGLVKDSHNIDLTCKLKPYSEKVSKKKTSMSALKLKQTNIKRRLCLGRLSLKNYEHKFVDDDLNETSSYVEVFRDNFKQKRMIVKKTSLCWLLRDDCVRLSSDRLERVKADMKIKNKKTIGCLGKYKQTKKSCKPKHKKM